MELLVSEGGQPKTCVVLVWLAANIESSPKSTQNFIGLKHYLKKTKEEKIMRKTSAVFNV